MVATLMTVGTQRHNVRRTVRTLLRHMLNVMHFQKRLPILLKWSWFATAFALSIGLLTNPAPQLGIAKVNLSGGFGPNRILYPFWDV
ncbi:hypothetical protein D3C81_1965460 [compost metagenome]